MRAHPQAKLTELEEEKARRLRVATSCASYIAQLRQKLSLADEECASLAPPESALSAAQLGAYEASAVSRESLALGGVFSLGRGARSGSFF